MNDQRKVIYQQRREIMTAPDIATTIADMRQEVIELVVTRCIPSNALPDQWDLAALHTECARLLNLDLPLADWAKEEGIGDEEVRERILNAADAKMAQKAVAYGADIMRLAERSLLLQLLDQIWKEHLLALDHLRQGINLRAYAQRDPLNEYKREAFQLFQEMLGHLREQVTSVLSRVELRVQRPEEELAPPAAPARHREPRGPGAGRRANGNGNGAHRRPPPRWRRPRPGPARRATRRARAARARNTSIATAVKGPSPPYGREGEAKGKVTNI